MLGPPHGWHRAPDEVRELVNERMFVADLEPGNPPVLHVWVIAIGDVNALPAAQLAFIAIVEVLEPMQVVQIPRRGGALAVDLQREESLVSARVARGLKQMR
jgi:hypothetical protein